MKPTESATRAERPFRRGSDEEKLFLAAVRMVPRHYRSFDMGCVMEEELDCGTACCFAGIVALLSGIDLSAASVRWHDGVRRQLGLDFHTSESLFYSIDWPFEFESRLLACLPRTPEYAAVAVERYMYFYRTGE